MPFSNSSQLSAIVGFIEELQPRSVLDVGVGFGQYGFLMRTNLEHMNLFELNGETARKRSRDEWHIVIDGIEGYRDYLGPVHDYAYNEIFIGNAMEVLPSLTKKYDLVIAIDILEHFDKAEGFRFIELLKQVSKGVVLVSTPKDFMEQHIEANPFEDHRSHWTDVDLRNAGLSSTVDNRENWIAYTRMDSDPR